MLFLVTNISVDSPSSYLWTDVTMNLSVSITSLSGLISPCFSLQQHETTQAHSRQAIKIFNSCVVYQYLQHLQYLQYLWWLLECWYLVFTFKREVLEVNSGLITTYMAQHQEECENTKHMNQSLFLSSVRTQTHHRLLVILDRFWTIKPRHQCIVPNERSVSASFLVHKYV